MTCPRCQASLSDESRFCNQCGASLAVVCDACRATNAAGSRFCSQCGRPLIADSAAAYLGAASPGPLDRGLARSPIMGDEQRRPVTVVFADIVGFTSLSERLDPEEVRDVTAACFGRLVEEIVRRGGTIDKFIGDAVMAIFGTPVAHDDDAGRAVDAALAMQATLGEINGELERDHGLRLELRIGVNTGEVVAGVREVGGFHDATVIGDTVNTASRLQTAATPGTVLVGEVTARLARHLFELEPTEPLTLKGKAEPVHAFRAVGPLTTIPVADAATVPLVGRNAELAALVDRVDRLERGEGGVVVITGEPGSGKSRLLKELHRMVEVRPNIRLGEAHATPYGPGQTIRVYASWAWAFFAEELTELAASRAMSSTLVGTPADDGAVVDLTLARLRERLDHLDVPEALPFLCFLLDLPRPDWSAHLDALAPEEIHRRSLRAIGKLHRNLAGERPCIVAVDDLHWAGPTILNFMEAAAELTTEAPLLLVLSFRADVDAPAWALREQAKRAAGDRYVELMLGPLAQPDSRALAQSLLGGATLDRQAEAILLSRIDGNPLYAFELIQTLVDRGALVIKNGQVQLDEEAARRVPESLQATILARIDRLPEEARRVVQTGAVLGRTFSSQLLTRVFGDGPALDRGLREALRAGVLLERPTPARPGYTFAQSLVQEVAERTLLIRRRRELHRLAVEAIEAIFPDELSNHAQGLARHAAGAEDWQAATRYALLAAERAKADYATREALRFYDLGLEASDHLGEAGSRIVRCQLLGGKSHMLANLGHLPESSAVLREALDVSREPRFAEEALAGDGVGARRFRAQLALALATCRLYQLDVEEAESAVAEAFDVLHDHDPELSTAWAHRAWALMHRNQIPEAAEAARTALRLALRTGGFEERARAYGMLTRPALVGEIGPSIATYAAEAVRLAREHAHETFLVEAIISLEVLRLLCLQPYAESALTNAQEALTLAQRVDSVPAEAVARVVLGAVYLTNGQWDDAERELTSDVAASSGVALSKSIRRVALARVLIGRGKLDEAHAILDAIEAAAFPHGEVWFGMTLALYQLAAGESDEALQTVTEAIEVQDRLRCLSCEAILGGMGSEVLAELAATTHTGNALVANTDATGARATNTLHVPDAADASDAQHLPTPTGTADAHAVDVAHAGNSPVVADTTDAGNSLVVRDTTGSDHPATHSVDANNAPIPPSFADVASMALALADRADRAGEGAFVAGRLMAARARVIVALQAEDWDRAIEVAEAASDIADLVAQPYERARLLLLHGIALSRRSSTATTLGLPSENADTETPLRSTDGRAINAYSTDERALDAHGTDGRAIYAYSTAGRPLDAHSTDDSVPHHSTAAAWTHRRRDAEGDVEREAELAQSLLSEALDIFELLGARPSIDTAIAELARLEPRLARSPSAVLPAIASPSTPAPSTPLPT